MNDKIVIYDHSFLSFELNELKISSLWHFVDFNLDFFRYTPKIRKILKFGMVGIPTIPNLRSSTVYIYEWVQNPGEKVSPWFIQKFSVKKASICDPNVNI